MISLPPTAKESLASDLATFVGGILVIPPRSLSLPEHMYIIQIYLGSGQSSKDVKTRARSNHPFDDVQIGVPNVGI